MQGSVSWGLGSGWQACSPAVRGRRGWEGQLEGLTVQARQQASPSVSCKKRQRYVFQGLAGLAQCSQRPRSSVTKQLCSGMWSPCQRKESSGVLSWELKPGSEGSQSLLLTVLWPVRDFHPKGPGSVAPPTPTPRGRDLDKVPWGLPSFLGFPFFLWDSPVSREVRPAGSPPFWSP